MKRIRFTAIIMAFVVVALLFSACNSKKPGNSSSGSIVSGDDTSLPLSDESSDGSAVSSGDAGSSQVKSSSSGSKSSSSNSGSTSSNPGSGNTDNSFNQNTKTVFKENVSDLKGVTIKLASTWNEWTVTSGSPPKQQAAAKALEQIAKDYNCKVQVVNVNANTLVSDIVTNYSAGKVYADIIEVGGDTGTLRSLYQYTEDVSKVGSLGLGSNTWNSFIGETFKFKGTQYGVGFMMTQNLAISQAIVMFNKTLAKEYGMPDLYQLVRDKKWTWDKFLELTKTAEQKSGGSVKGFVQQIDSTVLSLLYTNNIKPVAQNSEGQYFFNYNDNNLLKGLQFWSDYDKSGYLHSVEGTEDWGVTESKAFMARKSIFYLGDYICTSSQLNPYMNDAYGVLPLPMGPGSAEYCSVNGTKGFMLTKSNPNIEAAGKILVAMANRTCWNMKEWDDIQLETALRDNESLEMMHLITGAKQISDQVVGRGLDDEFRTTSLKVILQQSMTPIEAMQSIQGKENASIAAILG